MNDSNETYRGRKDDCRNPPEDWKKKKGQYTAYARNQQSVAQICAHDEGCMSIFVLCNAWPSEQRMVCALGSTSRLYAYTRRGQGEPAPVTLKIADVSWTHDHYCKLYSLNCGVMAQNTSFVVTRRFTRVHLGLAFSFQRVGIVGEHLRTYQRLTPARCKSARLKPDDLPNAYLSRCV